MYKMVNTEECHLFGDFGWILQAILGSISFSTLLSNFYKVKRHFEKNQRS